MNTRAANAYRKVDLESAPKQQIVERLFTRFDADIAAARAAIAGRDISARATAIDHALRIVTELSAALDHAAAPELCANLAALYNFVCEQLSEAHRTVQASPLDKASRVMSELGAAFREVAR